MRALTTMEIKWLLELKNELMDSDGHDKFSVQAECKSELEAIEKIEEIIKGEENG